jgi:hypothetical protein
MPVKPENRIGKRKANGPLFCLSTGFSTHSLLAAMKDKRIIHEEAPFSVERPADSNIDDQLLSDENDDMEKSRLRHSSQSELVDYVDDPLSENEDMVKLRERQRSQSGLADDDVDRGSGDDNDASQPYSCLDRQCCRNWPRTCSLFFGVVLPLWALIFISLIFGSILSQVEAPEEGRFFLRKDNFLSIWL